VDPRYLFRIDIGYQPGRGYAAVVFDVQLGRQKTIRGNSVRQLMRHVHSAVADEIDRKKNFPLENEPPIIIRPDGF
jgi:hypothetical protein